MLSHVATSCRTYSSQKSIHALRSGFSILNVSFISKRNAATAAATASSGKMMRAVGIEEAGGRDKIKVLEIPKPTVAPGKILVKNAYAGINFIDTYHRSGLYKVPLPYVLGVEGSGTVEAVGEGVTGLQPGDKVAYLFPGSYSQYSAPPADRALKLPEGVSLEEGGALLLQGMTAVSMATLGYSVKEGDTVLVQAAAGGTGQLLCQVCRALGAKVIGTCSSEEKAAVARAAGASEVVLYSRPDWVEEVLRITGGQGVQAVFDGVGKDTFDASIKCLARFGTMLTFGNASGPIPPVDILAKLTPKYISLRRPSLFEAIATPELFRECAQRTLAMMQAGQLRVNVQKVFPLEQAAQAHECIEGRGTVGKLLLQI